MKKIIETADMFALGGVTYGLIEILWRGYTHWTMVLLGGGLFLVLGRLNQILPERMTLLMRGLIGGTLITAAEFTAGCVLNLGLGLAVWDYSDMPLQLLGQVCLPYSLIWVVLAMVASALHAQIMYQAWEGKRFHWRLI